MCKDIVVTIVILLLCMTACSKEDYSDYYTSIDNNDWEWENNEDSLEIGTITVGQWNIGHFTGGRKTNSDIDGRLYVTMAEDYFSLISNINPIVFSINEYSLYFGTDENGEKHEASNVLFKGYENQYVGHQSGYSCNAIFSQIPLYEYSEIDYLCNQTAQITHTNLTKPTDYYLIESSINVNGTPTKLVSTHLAFDEYDEDVAKNQIIEIIDRYRNDDYVILCGDWNIKDVSIFNLFVVAGYQLANHGTHGDFVTYGKGSLLDNIIVKGYSVEKVKTINTYLSDHKPIIAKLKIKRL